jgi:hypothetical protein
MFQKLVWYLSSDMTIYKSFWNVIIIVFTYDQNVTISNRTKNKLQQQQTLLCEKVCVALWIRMMVSWIFTSEIKPTEM